MTATVTIEGTISEPTIRYTQTGKNLLEFGIGCTPRRKNKNTNEWENDGDPLWINVTLWNDDAERYADILHKGDRIIATGTLAREEFTRHDGTKGEKLLLRFPKIALIPKTQHNQQTPNTQAAYAAQQQAGWGAPAGGQADDPWGTQQQGAGAYGNPPF